MEVLDKREAGIRIATRADEYEGRIRSVRSWDQCADLAGEFHRTALQKGRELIEARFWLGGAVARAHSFSEWGDNYFGELSKKTGIGDQTLRHSMRLYDMFGGNVVHLHHWVSEFISKYGNVLWGDVDDLLRANPDRIHAGGLARKIRTNAESMEPGVYSHPAFVDLAERAEKKLDKMPIVIHRPARADKADRQPVERLTSIADAKTILFEEPDHEPVPILRVLLDGVPYIMSVFMQKEDE